MFYYQRGKALYVRKLEKTNDFNLAQDLQLRIATGNRFRIERIPFGWGSRRMGIIYGGADLKHLGTVVGSAIAGMFVMSVWGALVGENGLVGGWFAALIIIGVMWFLNHFVGLINNDGAWVDMAVGIGVAGTARGGFDAGFDMVVAAMPTLAFVLIGGIAGGACAHYLTKMLNEKSAE